MTYLMCLRDPGYARIDTRACLERQKKGRCPGCKDYDAWSNAQAELFDKILKGEADHEIE